MRCLYADHYSETHLMIEIDGRAFRPMTKRGVDRIIAERVLQTNTYKSRGNRRDVV